MTAHQLAHWETHRKTVRTYTWYTRGWLAVGLLSLGAGNWVAALMFGYLAAVHHDARRDIDRARTRGWLDRYEFSGKPAGGGS